MLHGSIAAARRAGGFTITFGRYRPSATIPRHDHEQASLCVALSGGYVEQLDRRSRRVDPGTLVVHPEGEAHANQHDDRTSDLLTIEFGAATLDLARRLSPLFDESWQRPAAFLLPPACRILSELDRDGAASDSRIEEIVWAMIGESIGYRHADTGRPSWLLAVRDRIDASPAHRPLLTALSEQAGVHPVHLARSFRRAFGSSIGAFARQRQAATALKLLAEDDLGLAEIGLAAGYADQAHMTRAIRDLTGRTPGAWRHRLGAGRSR